MPQAPKKLHRAEVLELLADLVTPLSDWLFGRGETQLERQRYRWHHEGGGRYLAARVEQAIAGWAKEVDFAEAIEVLWWIVLRPPTDSYYGELRRNYLRRWNQAIVQLLVALGCRDIATVRRKMIELHTHKSGREIANIVLSDLQAPWDAWALGRGTSR